MMKIRKKTRRPGTDILAKLFLDKYTTHSRFAESYRTLRTNIHFSFMEKDFRALLVTSAGEKEAKSTTVANLSYTIAQAGKSVLMVDADLRKPVLNQIISSHDSPGLTGLLSNTFATDVRSGSLSQFGVSDLFWLLSFRKKTGVLHLTEEKEQIDTYFLNGELVDVQWLTRPKDRKLATLLVKDNVITKDQAEKALARKRNTGQKLGFILINMGLVNEEGLAGFITLHMIEGLRTALQFRSGEFSFEKFPESHFDRPSFDPADLKKIYRQVVIGEEEFPYLQKMISAAIVKTGVKNLFILPSGPRPPKPAELLDSNRMSFLLSYLERRFDALIIDTPPVLPTSDALILAPQTDGVILMVKAGQVNRELVKKTVEQIRSSQARLIGVVLSQVDVKREGYYKYYHKYYAEYYGERT
jgi:Mrp family chromosome partitioning ATPase